MERTTAILAIVVSVFLLIVLGAFLLSPQKVRVCVSNDFKSFVCTPPSNSN